MLDNQIGPKFLVLAPADMARLSPLMNTKIILEVHKRHSLSDGTTPTLNLPM
jgi:hypothetical protein